MYDNVLVPTDGSAAVEEAIDRAIDLSTRYDATLHGLYVIEPTYTVYGVGRPDAADLMEDVGDEAVDEIDAKASTAGVPVRTEIQTGIPHRCILEYAEENDIDLIVMGTHGRTGLERYLIGSVTEKVVRLADVPVLTVPNRGDTEE